MVELKALQCLKGGCRCDMRGVQADFYGRPWRRETAGDLGQESVDLDQLLIELDQDLFTLG